MAIKQYQITPSSHFTNDLGLDSLDTVEVVMAIEEVCLAECANRPLLTSSRNSALRSQTRRPIPSSAVSIRPHDIRPIRSRPTVDKAVDYILAQPDGKPLPANWLNKC